MKHLYSSKVILLVSKIRGYNIANKPKKTVKVGKKSVDGLGVVELEDQHIETSIDEKISMESLFFSLFFKSMSHPTLSKIGIEKTHHHYSPWSFSRPSWDLAFTPQPPHGSAEAGGRLWPTPSGVSRTGGRDLPVPVRQNQEVLTAPPGHCWLWSIFHFLSGGNRLYIPVLASGQCL